MAAGRETRVNLLIGTAHFLSHFYVLCLPPMFLAWAGAFQVSYAELGLTVALMSGTTALLQTPVGFLVDRHGARPFLVGGTLLMSLAITGMGFATAFWQVLLLAFLSGVGNSVIHPADYAILTGSIAKERMGRAFAFHTFNGNLGFASGPPVVAFLMAAIGWREALIVVGLLGLPTVGAILLQSRVLVDQKHAHPHPAAKAPAMSGRELLLTRAMLLFFVFYMLSAMATAGVQSWLITVLHTRGVDLAIASTALTAYMAGASAGVLAGGWMSDRFNAALAVMVVVLTCVASGLLVAVDMLGLPDLLMIGLLFAGGLALGMSRTPRDVMVKDAAPPGQIGKVFGFVSAGLPLGQALTPVLFGFLIDRGHPELVLLLVAALLMLSLLCMGSARTIGPRPRRAAATTAA
ncbi:MAG TPA: MFS transporter [Acidisphaera sp.]|nr:MFS transporter [Acidisphaera sp.]